MSRLDLIIAIVILLFAGIGVLRGALRELISLFTWIIAISVAWLFSADITGWITWIGGAMFRQVVAFALLFGVVFIAVTLAALVLRLLFFASVPGVAGRLSGGMLGAFRGAVVVVVVVLLAGLTAFPQSLWWRDSALVPYFQSAALAVRGILPEKVAHQFRYR
ncbi:MAG: CvpA family protein [Acidiferrobacterales bacterium]